MINWNNMIPQTGHNPSADYTLMNQNNTSAFNIWTIDHLGFNQTTGPSGYHTIIHLVNNVSTPSPVAFTGELYNISQSDGIAGDDVLYFQTGGGINTRFSRNFAPTLATNGATFLPGGLILNWGTATVNLVGTPTNIAFTQPFVNVPYSITLGCINTQGNSPSENNIYIKSGTVSTSGFTVTNSSSGGTTAVYWMAIGS